eukprot:CAMPEP_0184693182 /NCGR_PEP_ID=MMETSP0313-20130426/1461_1 /TAXON_ID=2792 /ORGANISM="Porphyridium aerugineum, Strain SAG 1380-2" /LENGTH=932 /DNA_ID=CAMNT_0027151183 /DNA_START=116 /DNA_END=2914 /DNA_ORIENTATION=-
MDHEPQPVQQIIVDLDDNEPKPAPIPASEPSVSPPELQLAEQPKTKDNTSSSSSKPVASKEGGKSDSKKKAEKPKSTLPKLIQLEAYLSNHATDLIILLMIVLSDITMAWWGVWEFTAPHWTTPSDVLRYTLPIARCGGRLVSWNAALILLTGSKQLWTWIRKTPLHYAIPIDNVMPYYHKLIAWTIIASGCVIHLIPQIYNYASDTIKLRGGMWTFGKGVAGTQLLITGILLTVGFSVFYITTLEKIRRTSVGFRIFWIAHVLGIVVVIPCLIIHGTQRGYPVTVYFMCGPLLVYLVDVFVRRLYPPAMMITRSLEAKTFEDGDDKVVRLTLLRSGWDFEPGQYADLRIGQISRVEWHPFTIASPPDEEGRVTFCIKAAGRWTNALYDLVKQHEAAMNEENSDVSEPTKQTTNTVLGLSANKEDAEKPVPINEIQVDVRGPFGAPAQKFAGYRHVVVIGAGIGITPLISIWLHLVQQAKKRALESKEKQLEQDTIQVPKKNIEPMSPTRAAAKQAAASLKAKVGRLSVTSLPAMPKFDLLFDKMAQEGNVAFTDIFHFNNVESSDDEEDDQNESELVSASAHAGKKRSIRRTWKPREKIIYTVSVMESMTVNVIRFCISMVLETLVICLWIGEVTPSDAQTEMVATSLVLAVAVPKVILSGIAYRKRYLYSWIFLFELAELSAAAASMGFTIAFLIDPMNFEGIAYIVFFCTYLMTQVFKIFYILYATARPPVHLGESNQNEPSARTSRSSRTSRTSATGDENISCLRGIWVNKSLRGMEFAISTLAESVQPGPDGKSTLPEEYELALYGTRDKPDAISHYDPFDDKDLVVDEEKSKDGQIVHRKRHQVIAGRPNWHKIFHEAIMRAHNDSPVDGMDVSVFFCGAPAISRDLQSVAFQVTGEHEYMMRKQAEQQGWKASCKCRVLVFKENF